MGSGCAVVAAVVLGGCWSGMVVGGGFLNLRALGGLDLEESEGGGRMVYFVVMRVWRVC